MSESKNAAVRGKGTGSPRAERGQNIGRNTLQDRLLLGPRLVNQELVHAGFGIGSHHTLERSDRLPRIAGHHRGPAIQRADDRLWITTNLSALLVEKVIARAHLVNRAEGVPGIGVFGDD